MKKTRLSKALMVACGGVMLSAGPPAFAQNPRRYGVEITGSNIRRINSETASPVLALTREDIEKSGARRRRAAASALRSTTRARCRRLRRRLRLGRVGHYPPAGRGVDADPAQRPTHRAVRPRRRRPEGVLDLNLIPLEAVERIEILKDGGSAIYGSDAIAGVVNVILRKDFQGLAVNASYGATQYWNGQEKRASITGGFGDLQTQGFNVLANLEVGRQGEIYNRDVTDRDYVGRRTLRYLSFSANQTVASISAGGNGAIYNPTTPRAAGQRQRSQYRHARLLQPRQPRRRRLRASSRERRPATSPTVRKATPAAAA